jgi:hypothetical protein
MKNLAGELGLDRGLVIELLRNPPPKLLLMSDSLPDEAPSKPEIKEMPSPVVDEVVVDDVDVTETEPMTDLPIHVMSNEWSAQKRLKKVQLETLERVYRKSKRPTVSNIYVKTINYIHFIFAVTYKCYLKFCNLSSLTLVLHL